MKNDEVFGPSKKKRKSKKKNEREIKDENWPKNISFFTKFKYVNTRGEEYNIFEFREESWHFDQIACDNLKIEQKWNRVNRVK